jgi:hypothetical protein
MWHVALPEPVGAHRTGPRLAGRPGGSVDGRVPLWFDRVMPLRHRLRSLAPLEARFPLATLGVALRWRGGLGELRSA